MKRWVLTACIVLGGCAGEKEALDPAILGRWDVTVQGEPSYPLWFELDRGEGGLEGRMQPRTDHVIPLDEVSWTGKLSMRLGDTTFEGQLADDRWTGTGRTADGTVFDWSAERAPELPAPTSVSFGEPVELFNGKDLTGWVARNDEEPNHWTVQDGVLVNETAGSDLMTEANFWNFKLHIEVNVPEASNSGIYLRGRYEVQVQDDYGKEPDSLTMGGIYGRVTPTTNAAKPAGEWQSFDITLLGRWVTVVLNGDTIIDNQEIAGNTGGALDSNESEPGPIFLQGDHGRILYRNIVLTPAD